MLIICGKPLIKNTILGITIELIVKIQKIKYQLI